MSRASPYPAAAVLAVWMDIVPELRPDFDEWYLREHIPERVAVPGFRRGRRYRAVAGAPEYFAWYEVADIGVPTSAAYLHRLNNPTETTCRIMPGFRNMTRAICAVAAHAGSGSGGALATILVEPAEPQRTSRLDWIVETTFPALLARPGIVATQLWIADDRPTPHTREKELRAAADRSIEWALVVEGTDTDLVDAATAPLLGRESALLSLSCSLPRRALYQHMFTLDAGTP